jgi:hypothetical protein
MKSKLTTVFGILAICYGLFGSYLTVLGLIPVLPRLDPDRHSLFLMERFLCFSAKAGLLTVGILMLVRSRFALPLLLVIVLFLVADSVTTIKLSGPLPDGLSKTARAGQLSGRVLALTLPLILHMLLLGYLCLSKTRLEFSRH